MTYSILDPQVMTAGGYAMETVAWLLGSMMILQRVGMAVWHVFRKGQTFVWLKAIIKQRSTRLSIGIAGMFALGLLNRQYWLRKHTLTDEAFTHTNYQAFLISVGYLIFIHMIITSINGQTDTTFDIDNGRILLVLSLTAFVANTVYYLIAR